METSNSYESEGFNFPPHLQGESFLNLKRSEDMYTPQEREKVRKRSYTERMVDFTEPLNKEDKAHLDSIRQELFEDKEFWNKWIGWTLSG